MMGNIFLTVTLAALLRTDCGESRVEVGGTSGDIAVIQAGVIMTQMRVAAEQLMGRDLILHVFFM